MNVACKRVTRVAAASAVSMFMVFGTAADAATVVAIWDPLFGGTIGNFNWSGSAGFSIDSNCLATAATTASNANLNSVPVSPPGCAMSFDSTTVNLFTSGAGAWSETYSYDSNLNTLNNSTLFSMEVGSVGGIPAVFGISSDIMGFLNPVIDFGSPTYSGPLWLQWTTGGVDPVTGYLGNYFNCDGNCAEIDLGSASNPATVVLTTSSEAGTVTVPEPGTMSLALGALMAGGLARRRQTKT